MVVKVYKFEKTNYGKLQNLVKQDHFARNGYTIREGNVLNADENAYYLYISAPDEFFNQHEKEILDAGGKAIEGNEYELVKTTIEQESQNVASGIAMFD